MKKIPLTQGKFALVDDEDYDFLMQWKWHYERGYARRWSLKKHGKKIIFLHRVVNKTPVGMVTDHINRDKLDNRKGNLRTCTHQQNQTNKRHWGCSGYKGVYLRENGTYYVLIQNLGKQYYLGTFKSKDTAHEEYKSAAIKMHGKFASY